MNDCGYNGTATIVRVNGRPEWVRADQHIHVSKELVEDPNAMTQVGAKYHVGEWCVEAHAFHASLRPVHV